MAADQSTAIVLRTVEFSETSLIVTLLTRDFGRLSAIAKGARRPKGPFEGSLDLLGVCRVVVLRKASDSLDILTEAKLHRRFRGGERSLDRLYAGYYVTEMLRLLIDDNDPHCDVYDLTIETLQQIDGTGNIATALLRFDFYLLQMLGHAPGTDRCTDCGGAVEDSARVAFSLLAGGIVCRKCKTRQQQTISIRSGLLDLLRTWQELTYQQPLRIPNELYGETRSVLNRHIQNTIGRVPLMQSFLPNRLPQTDSQVAPSNQTRQNDEYCSGPHAAEGPSWQAEENL